MAIKKILLLGNEDLYRVSTPVALSDRSAAAAIVNDLRDTLFNFKKKYGFGRAIAAPQIAAFSRIIYMNFGDQSYALINPTLTFGTETFELWDDCMSFPGLEVKVKRCRNVTLTYKDLDWNDHTLKCDQDFSELIQHEYDHLDGILAVQRAIDTRSFRINPAKTQCF